MMTHQPSQLCRQNQHTAFWSTCGAFVLCMALFMGVFVVMAPEAQTLHAASQVTDADPVQWEYARLWIHKGSIRWLTQGPRVRADSLEDLIERLGGTRPANEDDISPTDCLLNMAGADGWELVSHMLAYDSAFGGSTEVWTFKRPR